MLMAPGYCSAAAPTRTAAMEAIPHLGRIVVFLSNGAAFERATDGSWSRYEVAEGTIPDNRYDDMRAASIPIG